MAQESGRTEQSGYQFKNDTRLQKLSSKPFCTSRTAGREIDRSEYAMPLKKKQTLSGKPAIIPNSQEINEHIFGTIKDNGVTITLI
jgi:hypothetical protein